MTYEQEQERTTIQIENAKNALMDKFEQLYSEEIIQEYLDELLDNMDISEYIEMFWDTERDDWIDELAEDISTFVEISNRAKLIRQNTGGSKVNIEKLNRIDRILHEELGSDIDTNEYLEFLSNDEQELDCVRIDEVIVRYFTFINILDWYKATH